MEREVKIDFRWLLVGTVNDQKQCKYALKMTCRLKNKSQNTPQPREF